ncbi:MAG: hypothetical protein WCL27_02725, partial [Betaproteobacteria bacterium]
MAGIAGFDFVASGDDTEECSSAGLGKMVKTTSFLSLRAFMLLLVGLMVAISVLFAAQDLRQSQQAYQNAVQLAERNSVADHCLRAVMSVTFERGRSHVLLL